MQVEFLGTGGAITIPRPGCSCGVCTEAREKGPPYARSGPSIFVHGPDILIDTPEEAKEQINRSRITSISAGFYSHWHPDHVMGRRLWEMNRDWRGWPPQNSTTPIYVPERVAADLQEYLGTWEHLKFLERESLVELNLLADRATVAINGFRITPFSLTQEYVFAFLIEGGERRLLIAPDELLGWKPSDALGTVNLAVLPMGVVEFNPLTGERAIPAEHPVLHLEAVFQETLDAAKALQADRIILTHIEEPDHLSYDDLLLVEEKLSQDGFNITFAYDGLFTEV